MLKVITQHAGRLARLEEKIEETGSTVALQGARYFHLNAITQITRLKESE